MIAAQLAKLSHGGDRSKPQNCGLPAKDAAKQLKVKSTRSVEDGEKPSAKPIRLSPRKSSRVRPSSPRPHTFCRQGKRDPTTLAAVQAKAPCRRYRSALRCPARKSQPDLYLYTHRREEFVSSRIQNARDRPKLVATDVPMNRHANTTRRELSGLFNTPFSGVIDQHRQRCRAGAHLGR